MEGQGGREEVLVGVGGTCLHVKELLISLGCDSDCGNYGVYDMV